MNAIRRRKKITKERLLVFGAGIRGSDKAARWVASRGQLGTSQNLIPSIVWLDSYILLGLGASSRHMHGRHSSHAARNIRDVELQPGKRIPRKRGAEFVPIAGGSDAQHGGEFIARPMAHPAHSQSLALRGAKSVQVSDQRAPIRFRDLDHALGLS